MEEASLSAWQGTVPEVSTGRSLLQHFDACVTCLLCVPGELLKTEQTTRHLGGVCQLVYLFCLNFESYSNFSPSSIHNRC